MTPKTVGFSGMLTVPIVSKWDYLQLGPKIEKIKMREEKFLGDGCTLQVKKLPGNGHMLQGVMIPALRRQSWEGHKFKASMG